MNAPALLGTHLGILRAVHTTERTVSELAAIIGRSVAWTSGCVDHLVLMDLVARRRRGRRVLVSMASNGLAQSLELLLMEGPSIDLSKVLDRAGLLILPVLLDPGATTETVSRRTGLSKSTIRGRLRRWSGMGIVMRGARARHHVMHPSQEMLASFIVEYARWRNMRALRDLVPDGVIVWQWRDEFMFSTTERAPPNGCTSAGLTRLGELGYGLLHRKEYYLCGPDIAEVGEEEALVQSMRVDPHNPRIARFVKEGIRDRGVDPGTVLELGGKYGVEKRLKAVVSGLE